MHRLFSRLIRSIDATFGTCSICIRKSFTAALAASGCWLAATLLWPGGLLQAVLGLAALFSDFAPLWWIKWGLVASGLYLFAIGGVLQIIDRLRGVSYG